MLSTTLKYQQQQIAILIISFLVYVEGIRNGGSGGGGGGVSNGNGNAQHNYESFGNSITSPPPSATTQAYQYANDFFATQTISQLNDAKIFRPSPIIDFTLDDVTTTQQQQQQRQQQYYPSVYTEPNYTPTTTTANTRATEQSQLPYEVAISKQFTFPNELQQQQQLQHYYNEAATASTTAPSYNYNYHQQQQQQQQQQRPSTTTVIPKQLQTTPILTYRDPFTNVNHIATSTVSSNNYPNNYNYNYLSEGPQEYTVHSSMFVGHGNGGGAANGVIPSPALKRENPYRPGIIYEQTITGAIYGNNGKYTSSPNLQQYNPNAILPATTAAQEEYSPLLPRPPTTDNERLSYDSHDYPPPSYHQQQTSNFQSPQREDVANYASSASSPPPPATPHRPIYTSTSNYANNYGGNYLLQGENVDYNGNYNNKRPSTLGPILESRPPLPPPPPPPASYYENEIDYAPIQRPPSSRPSYTNYYEYQQGEIPPPLFAQRPPGAPQRYPPPPPPPQRPPPPPYNYPHYRPPSYQTIATQPSTANNGLASLASLIQSTGQYAPQFTNLLLGGITNSIIGGAGAGGTTTSNSANNALGSILGALTATPSYTTSSSGGGGAAASRRPLNMQLIRALENIARNDDLQCVPKVLCQMIAGQSLRGQLPTFITSPAITNFLASFPASSPALIYGRAALLGLSGGDSSCSQSYVKCPKNEYEIIYYLNNHRGGFFKFFSEPDEQSSATTGTHQTVSGGANGGGDDDDAGDGGATSLFSILSALTGSPTPAAIKKRPRPRPQQQQQHRPTNTASNNPDVTSGIENFFSNVLSEYLRGVEYQRRSLEVEQNGSVQRRLRRSLDDDETDIEGDTVEQQKEQQQTDLEDFHDVNDDEEDEEDTKGGVKFTEDSTNTEGRILNKDTATTAALRGGKFFPVDNDGDGGADDSDNNDNETIIGITHDVVDDDDDDNEDYNRDRNIEKIIKKFNKENSVRKLKFPSATEMRLYEDVDDKGHNHFDSNDDTPAGNDGGGAVRFEDDNDDDYVADDSYADGNEGERLTNDDHIEFDTKATRNGKKVVFKDTTDDDESSKKYHNSISFPDSNKNRKLRKQRILNRPAYDNYVRITHDDHDHNNDDYDNDDRDADRFVISNTKRRRPHSHYHTSNDYNNHNGYYSSRPSTTSTTTTTTTTSSNNKSNKFSQYHSSNYINTNSYRPTRYPNYNTNSDSYRKYPQYNRYVTRRTTTTKRPDDQNIYITNERGITEYYVTPQGKKIYL